jgi:hypothetical protein
MVRSRKVVPLSGDSATGALVALKYELAQLEKPEAKKAYPSQSHNQSNTHHHWRPTPMNELKHDTKPLLL